MRPSKNSGNKIPSDTYLKVQLGYMKGKAHSSSEPPLKCNKYQILSTDQGWL